MQTQDKPEVATAPRPVPRPESAALNALTEKVDVLAASVAYLVERQKKQEELISEMGPILKEVLATATTRLDHFEKRGYFAFGRESLAVIERVVEGYSADDVRAFGDAIVSILDTVRTLTQPEVLAVMSEAGKVLEDADKVEPLGIVGMVRATSSDDVQKGMAVMMEVMRHVGRASHAFAKTRATSPTPNEARKQRLAEVLGPRRKKALGTERTPAPAPARRAAPPPVFARATSHEAPHCTPRVATGAPVVIEGVAFTPDGHLADAKAWTPELGRNLAAAQGVNVTDAHWRVIELARRDFEATGASPNIRRLTQVAELSTKDIYTLFPKAPGRTIAKIAGLPKPAGCL